MFLRFVCHFISGVVFFGEYAPAGMSPIIYSLVVNGPAVGVELLICLVILALMPLNQILKTLSPSSNINI